MATIRCRAGARRRPTTAPDRSPDRRRRVEILDDGHDRSGGSSPLFAPRRRDLSCPAASALSQRSRRAALADALSALLISPPFKLIRCRWVGADRVARFIAPIAAADLDAVVTIDAEVEASTASVKSAALIAAHGSPFTAYYSPSARPAPMPIAAGFATVPRLATSPSSRAVARLASTRPWRAPMSGHVAVIGFGDGGDPIFGYRSDRGPDRDRHFRDCRSAAVCCRLIVDDQPSRLPAGRRDRLRLHATGDFLRLFHRRIAMLLTPTELLRAPDRHCRRTACEAPRA